MTAIIFRFLHHRKAKVIIKILTFEDRFLRKPH